MGLAIFGLTAITLGWLVQFGSCSKKKPQITMWFLVFYILGVLLLILDAISSNNYMSALLNAASVFAATGVLLKTHK